MTSKIAFKVTEKAGVFVAGKRSPGAGEEMLLTESEAHHAEQLGELVRADAKPKGKGSKTGKPTGDDGKPAGDPQAGAGA